MRFWLAIIMAALSAPQATAQTVTAKDKAAVIEATAELLETRYVDPALGEGLARDLRINRPAWSAVHDGPALAAALTRWLRNRSGDGHLAVDYSAAPIPAQDGEEQFAAGELERYYGAHLNHGVEKVERLDSNIMLLDLRVFPPPAMGGDVIEAAMQLVAQGDALIIDLRRNGGGMESLDLILAHLLPPGSPLSGVYDRPTDRLTPRISGSAPEGRRFGEQKPLFLLTAKRTFSAAEALAYDLQALGRAVVVGEVTGGGANPFAYRRLHPHFALSLPEQRSINPVTGTNWQGVGVAPDVAVPAEAALNRALALARDAIASAPQREAAGQPGK
ncbi:S41 family peptidase [Sphingopyxis sp. MWB1]|uniref:S41 family peptidase n=1 Tax=Sphingopyxis sp. MWB1 TaxID=1537715 RepID=UPI00068BAB2A|nr:S41 family peptidase [Sphingopyxis sp. MWB1]